MKKEIIAAFAAAALAGAGCVQTVSDTNTFAVSYGRDSVSGRYNRSVDEVYQAACTVIKNEGVIVTEFIPHDYTNTVRSVEGRVNDCKVWIRVEEVDPKISQVDVEARTKWGQANIDLVHQLEKDVALELAEH